MPLNIPPARVKGDGGEVSDYNMIRQALIDTEARLVALEGRATTLEARPKVTASVSAPGSPSVGDIWIDLP